MTITLSPQDTEENMGKQAAAVYARLIRQNNKAGKFTNLGFPTGGTPEEFYKELVRLNKEDGLDFSKVRSFNLDEYVDLDPAYSDQSYHQYMEEHLFRPLRENDPKRAIHDGNIHFPDPKNPEAYDLLIASVGGLDVCAGGIGQDGHLAFIEPEEENTAASRQKLAESRTQVVTLVHQTIKDNSRFFDNDISMVPKTAVSMGLATMRDAKIFVLMACGEHKAEILKAALEGELNAQVPASFLQKFIDVRVFCDKAAASQLTLSKTPMVSDARTLAQAYSQPVPTAALQEIEVVSAVMP